ncbi:hypothetical protein L211DRAFT_840427 [Terfezia boudieri ATCC MYA-4762]|uniref:Uncharacterized protein n=1 Tax=Terfezia boudieri ATCC MYA-4762 TaxID=1051890 RepID=A0A3N4LFX7_9PEZI|nr:hypothetical protein L211DRAFT_840427 [Terfezia boudieri ATCC MYA-4762]
MGVNNTPPSSTFSLLHTLHTSFTIRLPCVLLGRYLNIHTNRCLGSQIKNTGQTVEDPEEGWRSITSRGAF